MPDDFVINVRQIGQYPQQTTAGPSDAVLLQAGGAGGAYMFMTPADLVSTALLMGGWLRLAPSNGIAWNGAALAFEGGAFSFSEAVNVPSLIANNISVGGASVATITDINALNTALSATIANGDATLAASIANLSTQVAKDIAQVNAQLAQVNAEFAQVNAQIAAVANSGVLSFNGRVGAVVLNVEDVILAGGAAINSPQFLGYPTAWTVTNPLDCSTSLATTQFVQTAIAAGAVASFNGRVGNICMTVDDIVFAGGAPINSPHFTGIPTAPEPTPDDDSNRIATTSMVHQAMMATEIGVASFNTRTGAVVLTLADITSAGGAPIASPVFTGIPQAPTATFGTTTGQIASCAFVMNAVTAATTGVVSFNTRTGVVTLTGGDISGAGGALLASPVFTGTPTGPTATIGTNSNQLATTAFVHDALAASVAGVASFNGRTGVVTLQQADLTGVGGALIDSPAFTGTPTAPTPPVGIDNTQVATTAWVLAELGAISAGVTTFNGRAGAVSLNASDISAAGGATVNSPAFTGIPTAPTAASGTSTQQIATTSFVSQALSGLVGVVSFNARVGTVTLSLADITSAGGAPLANPTFTGIPQGPTAVAGTSSAQLATTAFVANAGAALLASPIFTGTPSAPTAAQSVNNNQLATTAYVRAAIAALPTGGVSSFNTRTGAVVLTAADVSAAGGATLADPVFTGVPQAPTAVPGTSTAQIATTSFVAAALAGGAVVSFNTRTGAVVLTLADITAAGGAVNAYSTTSFIAAGAATYTTPADATTSTVYRIRMVGGGGAGGNEPTGADVGAGGAGGGQYKELTVTGRAAGEVWNITVGAGGVAPPQENVAWPGAANRSGGATTVNIAGNAIVCNGGQVGGPGTVSIGNSRGGVGGNGGATPALAGLHLVLNINGQSGAQGWTYGPGAGGSSMLGQGGQFDVTNTQPLPATGYGAGPAGKWNVSAGYVGLPGAVIIERIAG